MRIDQKDRKALDAVEFLHRACLHIPDPTEAVIDCYGHYANAEREDIIRRLRYLKMWPIAYLKSAAVDTRASPFNINLLRKLSD